MKFDFFVFEDQFLYTDHVEGKPYLSNHRRPECCQNFIVKGGF